MADIGKSNFSDKLTDKEKKDFIKSVQDNNLELFINYLFGNEAREPYDIFEEVSEPGNKWTIFHYVMHYGKWEIIRFIIEYLTDLNLLDKALKMKTSDNKCPMLCLLKSNVLDRQQIKEMYFKIESTFQIPISDEVINEANKRNFYDKIPDHNNNLEDQLLNDLISEDKDILKNELSSSKTSGGKRILKIDLPDDNIPENNNILKNEIFNHKIPQNNAILKNELTIDEKVKFYDSAVAGDLEEFKNYLNGTSTGKSYSIFEEVSARGYKWTTFHYAMHYGKWNIIKYILEYLIDLNLLDKALNMKTNDNRCPMLCLLKSNVLEHHQKKEIYFKLINTFQIPISDEVINEANKRYFYDENTITDKIINEANKRNVNYKKIENGDLKNELTTDEKMKFYYSAINDDLETFKNYINGINTGKPYSIFEEVSAPGYKWTTFHYAMHYGKWNIIKYILEYLIDLNLLDKALNIKSKDNRCPLLCLLRSNALNIEEKRKIFSNIIENYDIPISKEVKEELYNRKMQDLLNKYN